MTKLLVGPKLRLVARKLQPVIKFVTKRDPWRHSSPKLRGAPDWAVPAWSLLRKCDGADWVVLAMDGEQVVGLFRYCSCEHAFVAAGTWVAPSHRRLRIARKLWKHVFRPTDMIEVTAVTPAGRRFVASIASSFYLKVFR